MMGIELSCQFEGFEHETDYKICTDEQRLQQVLLNYQSNALKFTPRGGFVHIKAVLTRREGLHGAIEIEVQDTGLGIKEEEQGKLFKMFGFLESSKGINTNGIGLGLHICKLIAEQFGG